MVERSKEEFRQQLLGHLDDPEVLLDKDRQAERVRVAAETVLPEAMLLDLSRTYIELAEKITGAPLKVPADPRAEIIAVLRDEFGLVDQ